MDVLFGVSCRPAFEFLLVLVRGIGSIFHLCIFAGQGGGPTVGLKEFRGGFIASDFHGAQLRPLPD